MATIAFIGGGNMAAALIGGLVRTGTPAASLLVVEPHAPQREKLRAAWGVAPQAEADAALAQAALVVWAVKPQFFAQAAAPARPHVGAALHLSVMAGVRSDALVRATGSEQVVRAMPNTPALIGQGIAGLYARDAVSAAQRAEVERVLSPTGRLLWLTEESQLDAVTALSGSGPAYVFYLLEALTDAAEQTGLSREQGRELALATLAGATALAAQSELPPAALREQVTSKGGTTHAAISVLEEAGVKAAFVRAVQAACTRARELGDEYGRAG